MKNCDMCGSELKDGKCSCGIWKSKEEMQRCFLLIDERLFKIKNYVEDQIDITKKYHPEQFQCILILNQIKKFLDFLDDKK